MEALTRPSSECLGTGHVLHWYEIRSVLAEGSFGTIYTALDRNLGQPVALKEFFPSDWARRGTNGSLVINIDGRDAFEWGLQRFIDEARILASLRHPDIVRVLSVFEANSTAYIAMELESGESLADAVERDAFADESQLLNMLGHLLSGLEHLHGAGIIHRDMKPENVLIRPDGTPVILDLGAARFSLEGARPMTAVLTRGYAPFEQYDESGAEAGQGPWTDVYSLSALLYRMVTGSVPPDAMDRASELLRGRADPLVPAVNAAPDRWSRPLLLAIDAGLAFNAEDRPQSIAQWRARLPADSLSDTALLVPPPPRTTTTDRKPPGTLATTPLDLRVLIVDDEPVARNLAQRVLARIGINDVGVVNGGPAALAWTTDHGAPDVMLCDLDMPGMDGLELLRHLAERAEHPAVVLVSGFDKAVLRAARTLARALGLVVLGAIEKPVNPHGIRRMLEEYQQAREEVVDEGPPALLTAEEVSAGLERGLLEVVYQPMVRVSDRRVAGVEALARWRHPEHGLLGPSAFVGVADETGITHVLTDKVMSSALEACGNWCVNGPEIPVCINISVESLDMGLPERIVGGADAHGMSPELITLELTENRVMENAAAALEVLTRLRLRRVGLAIDDFGTGYSSLEQLSKVPFTRLKIDRAFVTGASADPSTFAILENSAELARSLGLQIVAEGVESQLDWDAAVSVGCDIVQGYFIARPMSATEVPEWVANWHATH